MAPCRYPSPSSHHASSVSGYSAICRRKQKKSDEAALRTERFVRVWDALFPLIALWDDRTGTSYPIRRCVCGEEDPHRCSDLRQHTMRSRCHRRALPWSSFSLFTPLEQTPPFHLPSAPSSVPPRSTILIPSLLMAVNGCCSRLFSGWVERRDDEAKQPYGGVLLPFLSLNHLHPD